MTNTLAIVLILILIYFLCVTICIGGFPIVILPSILDDTYKAKVKSLNSSKCIKWVRISFFIPIFNIFLAFLIFGGIIVKEVVIPIGIDAIDYIKRGKIE